MSALAATQIPKPADEQAFERASVVLWRHLLGDPNVQRNGRRGQRQDGVDVSGVRGGDPEHHVGVQCKLKGHGQTLAPDEIRGELAKALGFRPELREFVIATTAPDDARLQRLARELTLEQRRQGRTISVHVWGWDTLQERIAEHPEAHKAFDPSFGPFGERLMERMEASLSLQTEVARSVELRFGGIERTERTMMRVEAMLSSAPADSTIGVVPEPHLDAEIDALRDLGSQGKPRTAIPLLEGLLGRVSGTASGRILFRIKANLGVARIALGEDREASRLLADAYRDAPREPRAIANMALSMLLVGETGRLREFAARELDRDPTNEQLAGFLVQAARGDQDVREPLDLVPRGLHGCAAVVVARVDFMRSRRDEPTWWKAAQEAVAAFPDDPFARQFAAEAAIDAALRSENFQSSGVLEAGTVAEVRSAIEVLIGRWDALRKGEGAIRAEHVGLCCNILSALHGLGEVERAVVLARDGLSVAPTDGELATRAVLVGLDAGDDGLVDMALPEMGDGPDANLLRLRLYGQRGEWSKLAASESASVPEMERAMLATAVGLACIRTSSDPGERKPLEELVKAAAGNARASVLASSEAALQGHDDLASTAYRNALASLSPDAHQASRLMAARLAGTRGDWRTVANLLHGRLDTSRNGAPLRLLAAAHVNDMPIRRRALSFFSSLDAVVAQLPLYLEAAGLMHFNRGALGQAEAALRRAVAIEPNLTGLLALTATLRRRGRKEAIASVLEDIDVGRARGTPAQRVCLCQELLDVGRGDEAFDIAYQTVADAPNDPEAALRYVGLALRDPDGRRIPAMPKVAPDAWVRLVEAVSGETFEAVIEKGPDRPAEGIVGPHHPMVAAAMGLALGEAFERVGLVSTTTWRIAALKHKHLHALHVIMETFQTRYPGVPGIHRADVRAGEDRDFVARQARMASEASRAVADMHLVQNCPLALAAARTGRDAVGLAAYIASLDADVRTCDGNEPERLAARRAVIAARGSGAVMDTLTAWTAATLGVLGVLRGLFGDLIVPRSAVDELRIAADCADFAAIGVHMGWRDGRLTGRKVTRDDVETARRWMDERIAAIERTCRVEAVVAPDEPGEAAATLTEAFGPQILDAPLLAEEGEYVLLSDDLHYRQLAGQALGIPEGAWIQVALSCAVEAGFMDMQAYGSAMVGLASLRHGHLALDRATLLAVYADDDGDLEGLATLLRFIGNPSADMSSHVAVVEEVLQALWRSGDVDLKAMRATSALLARLVGPRREGRAHVLAFLRYRKGENLRRYIDAWTRGHFIAAEEVEKAEAEIARVRSEAFAAETLTSSRPARRPSRRSRNPGARSGS